MLQIWNHMTIPLSLPTLALPTFAGVMLLAGLCVPLPSQQKKQQLAESTEIVELAVSGMT